MSRRVAREERLTTYSGGWMVEKVLREGVRRRHLSAHRLPRTRRLRLHARRCRISADKMRSAGAGGPVGGRTANCRRLVLAGIDAEFRSHILVGRLLTRSIKFTQIYIALHLCTFVIPSGNKSWKKRQDYSDQKAGTYPGLKKTEQQEPLRHSEMENPTNVHHHFL